MSVAPAYAKLNLALVVGPRRPDRKHEVVTVLERLALADRIELEPAQKLRVLGFAEDTLVRRALESLANRAGVNPGWHIRIEKTIPVAAGLGGGSSDAATAMQLANDTLQTPLPPDELTAIAVELGADVPFFLTQGPQLGRGDGSSLEPIEIRRDYTVLLLLPDGKEKESTGAVYASFDERGGEGGFAQRSRDLEEAAARGDLAALPPNDLASSRFAGLLLEQGAFRADVTGAGPAVYGLFDDRSAAEAAEPAFRQVAETWITTPAW